ncbi:hypothetical protein DPMN_170512 [Dreissena polymorpha]|uniref:Uncharacterized protein n=1 Tax=Dreissena polymorpha TaxID=45954 RepID=A0A9D4DZX5_DREPO|nr:hypothetical protein DPMN_170512 [Dreissena polymorpha]
MCAFVHLAILGSTVKQTSTSVTVSRASSKVSARTRWTTTLVRVSAVQPAGTAK